MAHEDHETNRRAWNQMVEWHVDHVEYRTQEVINGGISLKRIELETLGNVTGKSLLHLQCQFGIDSLSWVRKGAVVTGVDISDQAIKRAEEIRAKVGLEATFIRCDIFDLHEKLDRQFDIVFQSYGTHCWISDIDRWGQIVGRYLKPGGMFFIVDDHPGKVMFYDPPLNYFSKQPERYDNPADYCRTEKHVEGQLVEWQHPIATIINALIKAGLTIERFDEYAYGYYREGEGWYADDDFYWYPPGGPTNYPLMFSLKAGKRG